MDINKEQELKSIRSMFTLVLTNYPENHELHLKIRNVSEMRLELLVSMGLLTGQEFGSEITNLNLIAGVKRIFRSFDKNGVKETLDKLLVGF